MSTATGEIQKRGGTQDVPRLIRAAGKPAVRAYREFLEDERLSAGTRRVYGAHVRRFFRWTASRDLTLHSITAANCTALTASVSLDAAGDTLSALRCLFRYFVGAGVRSANPFPRDPRGPRENYRGSGAPHVVVSPSMRTEPDVGEGDPWDTVLDQIDYRTAMLTVSITGLKNRIEKLCQLR